MDHLPTHPFPYFGILVTRDAAAIKAAVEKMYALKKPMENRADRVHEYKEFNRSSELLTRKVLGEPGHYEVDLAKVDAIVARSLPALETYLLGLVHPGSNSIHPKQVKACIEAGEKSFGIAASVSAPHLYEVLRTRQPPISVSDGSAAPMNLPEPEPRRSVYSLVKTVRGWNPKVVGAIALGAVICIFGMKYAVKPKTPGMSMPETVAIPPYTPPPPRNQPKEPVEKAPEKKPEPPERKPEPRPTPVAKAKPDPLPESKEGRKVPLPGTTLGTPPGVPSGWKEYKAHDGTFRGYFPGEPAEGKVVLKGRKPLTPETVWAVPDANASALSCWILVIPLESFPVEERIDALNDYFVTYVTKDKTYKLIDRTDSEWLGQKGKESLFGRVATATGKMLPWQGIGRQAVRGTMGYAALLMSVQGRPKPEFAKAFFDHFEVLK